MLIDFPVRDNCCKFCNSCRLCGRAEMQGILTFSWMRTNMMIEKRALTIMAAPMT